MSTERTILLSIVAAIAIIGIAISLAPRGGNDATANNVRVENGIQIVEITAKGGYSPRTSVAKAGIPTVVRFKTDGTYDCSSSVRIPGLGYSAFLPPSGSEDVPIENPSAGPLAGSCGMGMYSFKIDFRS